MQQEPETEAHIAPAVSQQRDEGQCLAHFVPLIQSRALDCGMAPPTLRVVGLRPSVSPQTPLHIYTDVVPIMILHPVCWQPVLAIVGVLRTLSSLRMNES